MNSNSRFVRVGRQILNIDQIVGVTFLEDGRVLVSTTARAEEGEWWLRDQDAEDIRALFGHIRTAAQIAADYKAAIGGTQ